MPKQRGLSLVQGSVDAWNTERRRLRELGTAGEPEDPFDVDLSGVSLRGRDLSRADLSDCRLVGADLREARLTWADFSRSDLREADLRDATLVGANFSLADVQGALFDDAVFGDTLLVRCDFAGARGLNKAVHRFDSVVDVQTLLRTAVGTSATSTSRTAAARFLRSAGVPTPMLLAAGFDAQQLEVPDGGCEIVRLPPSEGPL